MHDEGLEMDKFVNMFLAYADKSLYFKSLHLARQRSILYQRELLTLNAPLSDSEDKELERIDYLVDESARNENDIVEKICLQRALESLSELERTILTKFFYEGANQTEIAEQLEINQSTVSRTKAKALQKLQFFLDGNGKRIS